MTVEACAESRGRGCVGQAYRPHGSDKRGSVNLMSVDGTGPPFVQGRVEHRRGQLQPAYFLGAFFLRSAQ